MESEKRSIPPLRLASKHCRTNHLGSKSDGWLNKLPLMACWRIGHFGGAQATQVLSGIAALPTLEQLRAARL